MRDSRGERKILDAAIAVRRCVTPDGPLGHGYVVRGMGELRKRDLERICVLGSDETRREFIIELAIRLAGDGEKPLVIAIGGGYTPLTAYIPELRYYLVGDYSSVNILNRHLPIARQSALLSDILGDILGLSRDEGVYLRRGLQMAYSGGRTAPSMRDLGDRLLQIQAEVQPKDAYKVECLKNLLWELESGPIGMMSEREETPIKPPAVIDLSGLPTLRERRLVAMALMERCLVMEATFVVVDPADWAQPNNVGMQVAPSLSHWLEGMERDGRSVCLSMESSKKTTDIAGLTSMVFCGPIWGEELGLMERTFRLGGDGHRGARRMQPGYALACAAGREWPFLIRLRHPPFTAISPKEVEEHMRLLGEEIEHLDLGRARRERMLEKIFRDRAALVYAWEVLRLIQSGRVAVESVVHQRNATIKAVVRTLKRYFMIVEYTDSTGSGCYRLTKAGERAIAEMEGRDDVD